MSPAVPPTPGKNSGQSPKPTLSIRARLLVLALIAVGPLMVDRARRIETDRAERIAALSEDARALARQGAESQRELIIAVKSVVQVVARAYASLASSAETCTRFLAGATADAPWIAGLSIIGDNGRVACSTAPKTVGLDVTDRPYFQQALQAKSFIVSAEAVGRARGTVGMIAAVPVRGEDGSVTGVITAGFELQWIDRIADEVARRRGAMMLIVDQSGIVLAAEPGEDNWLRKKLDAPDLLHEMNAREDGLAAVLGPDGVRRSFGFIRLPSSSAFLAIGLDEAEMLRRVDREMRLAYLQFALIGAFVLLGVWFGGEHTIVRPLRALARMAAHVGHGNLAARTTHRPWAAEFAPLANALDAMAQQLTAREEELEVATAHLDQLTRLDSLSGLTNRRGFDARLDAAWELSAQSGAPLALVMIDVDHFKAFNDRYGHVAGDMCLRTVAEAIAGAAGDATVVARYGGEEFALLFGRTTLDRALDIAERLRATIESLGLTHQASPLGHVTASVGVAALAAAPGESSAMLIEAADAALYGAKRRGRNTVVGHSAVTPLAQIA
jgi:diguanylate cyclase (GGDEF)-like protein